MAENKSENSGDFSPQPQFEIPANQEVKGQGQERQAERAIEKRPASENSVGKQAPPMQPALPPTATQIPVQQSTQDGTSSHSSGLKAAELDLIEKQWVEKAKKIINHTHDDPYKQKNEMTKFKADYIKKRFNKTIPIDDTAK
jgi:hypothetical protein